MRLKIDLEDFCEGVFHHLEQVQDGYRGHSVIFEGESEEAIAFKVKERLLPFIQSQLKEVTEDDEE